MRSAILLAAFYIGDSINKTNIDPDVVKVFAWVLAIFFFMDVIECINRLLK